MSETVRVRLLLAKWESDTEPVIVAAVDQSIWDYWDDDEERAWIEEAQRLWGIDATDLEWKQAWAEFAPGDLAAAFMEPTIRGQVHADTSPQ